MPSANAASAGSGPALPEGPVFILGMHRSGTTLLYQMLAELGHWNTLWAWHVACYEEIRAREIDFQTSRERFAQRLAASGEATRGVDNVAVKIETKEEFSFILLNKGYPNTLSYRTFPEFLEICETVQSTYPERRPLLLKNPWDFGQALEILELIPDARFICIHRDPVEMIDSQFRFLVRIFREPNAYLMSLRDRYAEIVRTPWQLNLLHEITTWPQLVDGLIMWCARQTRRYLGTIESVPPEARIELTYDELCARPDATIARIRSKFGIPDNGVDFSGMIGRRGLDIHPKVVARSDKIERRMSEYRGRIARLNREAGLLEDSRATSPAHE